MLVLLTGTPETHQVPGGFQNRPYSQTETLGNIQDMIGLVLTQTTIPLILVAPPPVLDACGNCDAPLSCGDIDCRLANLADEIALRAIDNEVLFLDLYEAFHTADSLLKSLFRSDGLHPRLETGDALIASLLVPLIEQALMPEPSTAMLLASGLLAPAHRQRGRRKAA